MHVGVGVGGSGVMVGKEASQQNHKEHLFFSSSAVIC